MVRSRAFCFTLNNYTEADEKRLSELSYKYLIYGREIAPETQTPHLQGYVYFKHGKTFEAARRLLIGCHIELAKGSSKQNKSYCSKGGNYIELGEQPLDNADKGLAEQERWRLAREAATKGEYDKIPDQIFVQHFSAIRSIASHYCPDAESTTNCTGIWLWGSSGTGKTQCVRDQFPGCYFKMCNKWWDGYDSRRVGHGVVYLDDLDPQHASWTPNFLKIWGDKHPFRAEIKGTSINIRPKMFIVTSQYRITQMGFSPEDTAAIERRYVEIEKIKLGDAFVPIVWPTTRTVNITINVEEEDLNEISLDSLDL